MEYLTTYTHEHEISQHTHSYTVDGNLQRSLCIHFNEMKRVLYTHRVFI